MISLFKASFLHSTELLVHENKYVEWTISLSSLTVHKLLLPQTKSHIENKKRTLNSPQPPDNPQELLSYWTIHNSITKLTVSCQLVIACHECHSCCTYSRYNKMLLVRFSTFRTASDHSMIFHEPCESH